MHWLCCYLSNNAMTFCQGIIIVINSITINIRIMKGQHGLKFCHKTVNTVNWQTKVKRPTKNSITRQPINQTKVSRSLTEWHSNLLNEYLLGWLVSLTYWLLHEFMSKFLDILCLRNEKKKRNLQNYIACKTCSEIFII